LSKRYGRNQKRRDREEIARLRKELDLAITGGFARARPGDMALEDFIGTPISIDINDSEDGFTITRKAVIRALPASRTGTKSLCYHVAYSGFVAWRGIRWITRMPHLMDPAGAYYDAEVIEIELQALGDRDDRQPIARPHFRTVTGRLAA